MVRVFPELAYAGGWWVVFGVEGGAAVETLFIKISLVSMSHCGVCRITGTKLNLCRIRGNIAPKSKPRRLLVFCFHLCDKNRVMFMFLFVYNSSPK